MAEGSGGVIFGGSSFGNAHFERTGSKQQKPHFSQEHEKWGTRSGSLMNRLEHYGDCDADAGMEKIEQEIFAIYIVDIAIIGVVPARRPGINHHECIAAVGEARRAIDHGDAVDVKHVLTTVAGAETVIRNASRLHLPSFVSALHGTLLVLFLHTLVFLRAVWLRTVFLLFFFLLWFLFLMFGRLLREGWSRDTQNQIENYGAAHS